MQIDRHDLSGTEIEAFLEDHLRQMREVTPEGSKHALDLDSLRGDDVSFWVVRDDEGRIVGSGALKALGNAQAEVKSMRSEPTLQRSGIATMLLGHMFEDARRRGIARVDLETGNGPFCEPARKLYEKHGSTRCAPFGEYREDPNSAYYTLEL